ncbi:hypothetical protein XELAEV_18046968mg [Xenopus laevis]|uniref:Uncharacterized protein n=1 Tax=Xenopus laevis TaxID=8355 RepID=A0A974BTY5_XENLA|nr:hypothetical protein XELAEV_18046968mg [Xenopus laevis]
MGHSTEMIPDQVELSVLYATPMFRLSHALLCAHRFCFANTAKKQLEETLHHTHSRTKIVASILKQNETRWLWHRNDICVWGYGSSIYKSSLKALGTSQALKLLVLIHNFSMAHSHWLYHCLV